MHVQAPSSGTVPRISPAKTTKPASHIGQWIDWITLGVPESISTLIFMSFRTVRVRACEFPLFHRHRFSFLEVIAVDVVI